MARTLTPIITHWSASKLTTLLSCPRMFDFRYIRQIPSLTSPWAAHGSAIHYMFERFFKVNFETEETYCKAGVGFWMGVMKGEHGPSSYSAKISPPVTLNLTGIESPGMFIGMTWSALKKFWRFNQKFKGVKGVITEKRVFLNISGLKFRGIIDRIQPVEKGIEIWDYKPRTPTDLYMAKDIQMTGYDLWCRMHLGQVPEQLGIYNYKQEGYPLTFSPPRKERDFEQLFGLIGEASEYVRCVCLGREPDPRVVSLFQNFSTADIASGRLSARMPIGGAHCRYCDHGKECLEADKGNMRATRTYVSKTFRAKINPGAMLFAPPKIIKTTLQRRLKETGEIPEQELRRKPGFLELHLPVESVCTDIRKTKYGRCSRCNYALNKSRKCSRCRSWFNAKGEFLPEKTWKLISKGIDRGKEADKDVGVPTMSK